MSNEHNWAFGHYEDGGHYLQITNIKGTQRIPMKPQDVFILREMLGDVIKTEDWEESEVFD